MRQACSTARYFFDSEEHLLLVTNSFIDAMLIHRLFHVLHYLWVGCLFTVQPPCPPRPYPQPSSSNMLMRRSMFHAPCSSSQAGGGQAGMVYDLFGVVNHMGGMTGGHYTACCRSSPCSKDGVEEVTGWGLEHPWLHFDDEFVEVTTD